MAKCIITTLTYWASAMCQAGYGTFYITISFTAHNSTAPRAYYYLSPVPDKVSGAQRCEVTQCQSLRQCQQWNPNPELCELRFCPLSATTCLVMLAFWILEGQEVAGCPAPPGVFSHCPDLGGGGSRSWLLPALAPESLGLGPSIHLGLHQGRGWLCSHTFRCCQEAGPSLHSM